MLALAALFATLPFVRPTVLHIGGAPAVLPDLALVAVWAFAGIAALRRRLALRFDGLFVATAAYVAVLALSAVTAEGSARGGLLKLAAYSLYLMLPWLTACVVDDERDLATVAMGFLLGAAAVVALELVGVAGFYAHVGAARPLQCSTYGLLPSGAYPRMCVTFGTANMLADFLILALAVLLGAEPMFPRAAGRTASSPVFFASLAALTLAALLTLSAGFGGYVLTPVIVTWAWLRDAGRLTPARRLALVVVGAGACVFFLLTMISSFVPAGDGHLTIAGRDVRLFSGSRWSIWSSSLDTVRAHPWLGKGYGAHVATSDDPSVFLSPDQIKALGGRSAGTAELEAHDVWLNVAGQAGLVGLVAFVALMGVYARRFTLWRATGALPYLGVALTAGFVASVFYHGIFSALEESRNLWGFIGLLVAAAAVRARAAPVVAGRPSPGV
ncbi:MAG TPA: O-antigen ligase family protein [Byssovorax sp.]